MITSKGQRYLQRAKDGGLGFCWQHLLNGVFSVAGALIMVSITGVESAT